MRINDLTAALDDDSTLEELCARRLKVPRGAIRSVELIRKAIDARRRHGAPIVFNYVVDVEYSSKEAGVAEAGGQPPAVASPSKTPARPFTASLSKEAGADNAGGNRLHHLGAASVGGSVGGAPSFRRPVVIGFGPAGMFAALTLARAGFNPIVFERGSDVDTRSKDVEKFFDGGDLNPESNVQFGEGGAGTFSDGKLTTRIDDPLTREVIDAFIDAGAPTDIKYLQKPHIGTDRLRGVVKNIRKKILALGGEIFFNARLTDIEIADGRIKAAIINAGDRLECDAIFLGIGHSARDTYEMLSKAGVLMEPKAFAIGVRIEHPQEFIDRAQYGADFDNPKLPRADYFLTYKGEDRGAYTFCMCPGGTVIAAATELGVVTNGMSCYDRASGVANAAVLSTVGLNDFDGRDPLCGVRFQKMWEARAFDLGGRNYRAPIQTVGDFLNGRSGSKEFWTTPTYPRGFVTADLHECLPSAVARTLEEALRAFDRKIKGFASDGAVLTGVETRTSAPLRIVRDRKNFMSANVEGLYPIGEGAGYAGGIMSSAVDGMKAAMCFID